MTDLVRREAEFLLYQTEDGRTRVEVRFDGDTAWLSLGQMAELFQRDKSVISRHVKNVFDEGELNRASVVAESATTAADGKTYRVEYFNLDVIISVGYRVKSHRGAQFRIWATQRLREYIVKGFALDDERLKRGGGGNYFDELLARIRDIRSSEKVFWRKVLDIYATSIDYDPRVEASQRFFATVQNKMHWAAHGHTAAEVVAARADATKPDMGLTNWPGQVPRKGDAVIARNYLDDKENRGAEPDRRCLPRVRRAPGDEPQGDAHGRLDREARRLPQAERPRDPRARRPRLPRRGDREGREGVRALRPGARHAASPVEKHFEEAAADVKRLERARRTRPEPQKPKRGKEP